MDTNNNKYIIFNGYQTNETLSEDTQDKHKA